MLRVGLIPVLFLCVSVFAASDSETSSVITTEAELEAHLATNQSPLRHLSETGRRVFLDGLWFDDSGAFPTNHHSLHLELTPGQIREVLALFGREDMAPPPSPGGKSVIAGRGSRHLATYYDYLQRLNEIAAPGMNWRNPQVRTEMHELLKTTFGQYLNRAGTGQQAPSDLRVLHEAVAGVLFHTNEPGLLTKSREIADQLAELARKQEKSAVPVLERTRDQLLAASEFEKAAAFAEQHGLPTLDVHVDAPSSPAGPMVLVPEKQADGVTLRAAPAQIEQGVRVIVTVSPECSYSLAATRHIEADDELRALLAGRTRWVADPRWASHLDRVLEWNSEASEVRMALAYRERDWPAEIDLGRTPMFYIYQDGEVIETIAGWQDDSQGERLQAVLGRLLADQ